MNEDILKQINALNPWFYNLTIDQTMVTPGLGSLHSPEQLIADTEYKHKILIDAIVERYNFKNKRLLDIASNCGYWSSYYARQGAKYLLAVEGRERFIEQGNLYWQHGNFIKNAAYQFLLGDINNEETWQKIENQSPFDFVLCCGILYHICNHRLLLQRIVSVATEAVLIDTRVSEPGANDTNPFIESGNWKFDGINRSDGQKALASHPTLESIQSFFINHGYSVEKIHSSVPIHPLMYPKDNYDIGKRVTLLCRKNND